MSLQNIQLLVFLELFGFFFADNTGMTTTALSATMPPANHFFCSTENKVVIVFNDDSTQSIPRVLGLVDDSVCDTSVEGRAVELACGTIVSVLMWLSNY